LLNVDGRAEIDLAVTLTDRPNRVSGAVRDLRGMVVAGAAIVVQPATSAGSDPDVRRARVVRSGWNGLYAAEPLAAGEYVLTALPETSMDGWQEPRRLSAIRAAGTRVVIKDGDSRYLDLLLAAR
jgi:hypothetical protein